MLNIRWQGYRIAAWLGQMILALAVLWQLYRGEAQNALALGLFLGVSLVFVFRDDRLPTLFDCLFVIAALLNAGGWVWGWFYLPGPYDEIVHGFTTFAVTLALSFLVYQPMLSLFREHRWLYLLTIASFGIAIGALWEVTEWAAGWVLGREVIGSINDTITDLIMDTFGAGLAAVTSLWALKQWTGRVGRTKPAKTYSGQGY